MGIRAHAGKGMGVGLADFDLRWLDGYLRSQRQGLQFLLSQQRARHVSRRRSFDAGVALTEDGQFISGMGVDARDLDNDGLPDIAFVALENETFPSSEISAKATSPTSPARKRHGTSSPSHGRLLPASPTWTTMAGRTSSSRAAMCSRSDIASEASRLSSRTRYSESQPGCRPEVSGAHRRSRVDRPTRQSPSRLRRRRPQWRRAPRRGVTALAAPAEMWLNDSPGWRHWLEFTLEGTNSNRDGIGARIKVTAGGTRSTVRSPSPPDTLLRARVPSISAWARSEPRTGGNPLALRNHPGTPQRRRRSHPEGPGATRVKRFPGALRPSRAR